MSLPRGASALLQHAATFSVAVRPTLDAFAASSCVSGTCAAASRESVWLQGKVGVCRLGVQCIYQTVHALPPRPLPITDPREVRAALRQVEDRDRRVIELRYGLEGGRQHSRAEIGRLLGISRERVRQLEKRALDRLSASADPGGAHSEPVPPPRREPGTDERSRRSFLRSWTLLLLQMRPAHVYELRARLRDLGLPPANYRLLQSLEDEGFLH